MAEQDKKHILSEGMIDEHYDMYGIEFIPDVSEEQDRELHFLKELYFDMTGSIYSVYGDGSNLTVKQVLYIYLLKYRYITIEQFRQLFPTCSKNYLSVFACRNNDDIRRFTDGVKTYYSLSSASYLATRSLFPEDYIAATQIPTASPSAGSIRFHELQLSGIPYSMLRTRSFRFFEWFASAGVYKDRTVMESILETGEIKKDVNKYGKAKAESQNLADGIALFADGHTAIFEMDCDSENITKVHEKIKSYADYFSSLAESDDRGKPTTAEKKEEARHCQLIICIAAKPVTSRTRNRRNTKSETGTHTSNALEKAKEIMEEKGFRTLSELMAYTDDMLSRHNRQYSVYSKVKALLKDYSGAGHDLFKGIDSLEKHFSSNTSVQYETRMALRRCRHIRTRLYKYLYSGSSSEDLSVFPRRGISLIVTENFDRYARFIMFRVSGFFDQLVAEIRKKHPGAKCMCSENVNFDRSYPGKGLFVNNAVLASGGNIETGAALYIISEISCDVAEYIHMMHFINIFRGVRTGDHYSPVHILFLVSSIESAVEFANQTGIDELFYSDFDISKPDSKNVTIRFLDYSAPAAAEGKFEYFVVDSEGNKVRAEEI